MTTFDSLCDRTSPGRAQVLWTLFNVGTTALPIVLDHDPMLGEQLRRALCQAGAEITAFDASLTAMVNENRKACV